ncbi:hypothetical protein LNKW23_15820 [Paralimibaculum aggregatum]|uniref:Tetratricopeptide repeat protein n=1 Tax=Paralimibaculum aggregatum TaxID=3036245 RepID=A0ABQ6LGC2_9RHOB|nr:tetratricopeptide repeat protein [Limibaculum sp. NKW23]GMG82369.1 hypothetical protein LNKW23_15820 [Limibaculum sp. NKW23]
MRRALLPLAVLALFAAAAPPGGAIAQSRAGAATPAPAPAPDRATSVFDLPRLQQGLVTAGRFRARGRLQQALAVLDSLARQFPDQPDPLTAIAVLRAEAGDTAGAIRALSDAVDLGFDGLDRIAARGAGSLAEAPGFAEIRDRVAARGGEAPAVPAFAEAQPALITVEGLSAPVREDNTEWDPTAGVFRSLFEIPPVLARRPVLGRSELLGRIAPFLNRWYAAGRAAGNVGDLYDNRDRSHSPLARGEFQQLLHVDYGPEVAARGFDYGPQRLFEFGRITFGNSSTALVDSPAWRSQTRRFLTEPGGADALFRQYSRNQLYIYPSKDDYGPEHGDLMPANTPYGITSHGASLSDQPFLRAVAVALAALQPGVKRRLREEGLIAPTLQRLIRRSLKPVQSETDYLSHKAHPSVFDAEEIDFIRLVRAANALSIEQIPPMVRLTVLRDSPARDGREHFSAGLGEELFDTPSAIARIHRSSAGRRRMTVSARATRDPAGKPLRFVWRVLQGDADRIEIRPQTEDGSVVELEIPWHDRFAVPGRPGLTTTRVDIAAFAVTPGGHSAPAFVSVTFPPQQKRVYDAEGRPLLIDYADKALTASYADPKLFPLRPWRDSYRYDDAGRLLGWVREGDGAPAEFDAEGRQILSRDAEGRPLEVVEMRYEATLDRKLKRQVIGQEPGGQRWRYAYAGPEDRSGRAEPLAD